MGRPYFKKVLRRLHKLTNNPESIAHFVDSFEDLIKYVVTLTPNHNTVANIRDNFEYCLNLCNDENIIIFVDELKNNPKLETILNYNADILCNKFGIKIILEMTKTMPFQDRFKFIHNMYEKKYTLTNFINDLIINNENEYIISNMESIIDSNDILFLMKNGILKKLKHVSPQAFNKLHPIIITKLSYLCSISIDSKTINALNILINEIAQNEKTDISEIERIGSGCYSTVYKVGNKVIKLGANRVTHKIPYHRRILQPLIRRPISTCQKGIYIEIAEYTESDKSITDEDVYQIYKELRDDGIIWLDAKASNLGRLTKDNVINYSEPLHVDSSSVGLIDAEKKEPPLPKGELVIIDTDLLFREEDFDINSLGMFINLDLYYKFETRYQKEKGATVPFLQNLIHFFEK